MASRSRLFSKIAKDVGSDGNLSAAALSPDVSFGATVYDSTGLLPYVGNDTGDQAYVKSNNRFYIWDSAGWYNVALINKAPNIASVLDSNGGTSPFALAIDGTATTITITATDSDGDPITYSATTDGNFSGLATLSQDGNVFTITPLSQDSATTQSSLVTFKATDGVNISSALSTFTLNFLSAYWDETVLSIGTSSTNSLDNSTFIDRSTNAHTVTPSGSPIQTAFHPYLDNWSIDTNNSGTSGGHLRASYETPLGTSDFSIEAWVYYVSGSAGWTGNRNDTSGGFASRLGSTSISLGLSIGGTYNAVLTSSSYPDITNKWTHIAICRSSGTTSIYVDGNRYATTSTEINWNLTNQWTVGYEYDNYTISDLVMHISNYRLVNGSSAYDATQTSITVPTEKLTAITNTQILTCQDNRFVDNSGNNVTFDIIHAPIVSAFNPFGQGSEYASGENKGSVYLDASSAMTLPHSTDFELGSSDFTISGWIYPFENTSRFISTEHNYGSLASHYFYLNSSGYLNGIWYSNNSGTQIVSDSLVTKNEWHHVAMGRTGNTIFLSLDGVVKTTSFSSSIDNPGVVLNIGQQSNGSQRFSGYISDLRFDKGTVQYESTYTVPSAPVTTGVASGYYLPFDNAGIYDKTGNNTVTVGGNASTSTTQTKYATTSIAFDGSGDYIRLAQNNSLILSPDEDFTIEGWVWLSSLANTMEMFCQFAPPHHSIAISLNRGGSGNTWVLLGNGSSWNGVPAIDTGGTAPLGAQQWHHVALVKNGSTITIYHDANQAGQTTTSFATTTGNLILGAYELNGSFGEYLSGYIEGFQVLKGVAKYTSPGFTLPTQPQGRIYQAES